MRESEEARFATYKGPCACRRIESLGKVLPKMSVAEYLEMIRMTGDSIGYHAMNAVAILFAYITAAYLAGSKMSRLQLGLATSLYTVFYFFPSFSAINNISNLFRLTNNFATDYPEEALRFLESGGPSEDFFLNPLTIAFSLAWVAGILFMIDTRRRLKSKRSQT